MADLKSPNREPTPGTILPQKRLLEDDHQPAISSPLNPDFSKDKEDTPMVSTRAPRAKKDSFKKRESKGPIATSSRGTPAPKSAKGKRPIGSLHDQAATLTPTRWTLHMPKPSHYEAPRGPVLTPAEQINEEHGGNIVFNETSDHVRNKKGFHYTHCIADPLFRQINFYRQTETEPFHPRFSFEDTASHIYLDESATHITSDKGWRSAKANVGVREGKWYYECKITKGISQDLTTAHVRMGWGRREANNEAPVGIDAYSYAIRDKFGQKVHMARPKDFAGTDFCQGDVIGLEIYLPSEQLHRKVVTGKYNRAVDLDDPPTEYHKAPNIVRERVPIHFKTHMLFEQYAYHSCKELEDLVNPAASALNGLHTDPPPEPSPNHHNPALRTLPHSYIQVYKNGEPLGKPFENLLAFLPPASKPTQANRLELYFADDGMLGYYPMVSVFQGGAAEINLGPNFWFPPPGYNIQDDDDEVDMVGSDQPPKNKSKDTLHTTRAVGERYFEQIAEDIVYDIIDETHFYQENLISGDGSVNSGTVAGGAAGGEIRELVQDDE